MKIIRDNKLFGLGMIPLFVDWNIKRCNQKDCTNRPNTIIRYSPGENPAAPEGIMFGLCEEHFQQANTPGGTTINLEFGDGIPVSGGGHRYDALFVNCVHNPTVFGQAKLYVPDEALATEQFDSFDAFEQELACSDKSS